MVHGQQNILHFGINTSLLMTYKAKVTVCSESHNKHIYAS
jgi:hypothetical protein